MYVLRSSAVIGDVCIQQSIFISAVIPDWAANVCLNFADEKSID